MLEGCDYWVADWNHSVIPSNKPCDGSECPQCKDLNAWLDSEIMFERNPDEEE